MGKFENMNYLSPVRKDLSISSIRHKFLRELGYSWVKVVHYHVHYCGSLPKLCRVLIYRVSPVTQRVYKVILIKRHRHLIRYVTIIAGD